MTEEAAKERRKLEMEMNETEEMKKQRMVRHYALYMSVYTTIQVYGSRCT